MSKNYIKVTFEARWANDHDVAHLQAKTIPMNLIWSESAQWLWSYSIRKVRTDGRTDGRRAFYSPPYFLRKGGGQKNIRRNMSTGSL